MAVSGKGMKKGAESLLEHVGRNKPYLKKKLLILWSEYYFRYVRL